MVYGKGGMRIVDAELLQEGGWGSVERTHVDAVVLNAKLTRIFSHRPTATCVWCEVSHLCHVALEYVVSFAICLDEFSRCLIFDRDYLPHPM